LCPEHDRCSLLLLSFPCACVCKLLYRHQPVRVRSFVRLNERTDGQTLGRPGRCRCGCKWKTDGLGKRTNVRRVEPRHRVTRKHIALSLGTGKLLSHTPSSVCWVFGTTTWLGNSPSCRPYSYFVLVSMFPTRVNGVRYRIS
jgi:hypothetical protein